MTPVLVALITAVPATVAAVVALKNRRSIRTPSGDPIGRVMERTHEASVADVALTRQVHDVVVNGGNGAE